MVCYFGTDIFATLSWIRKQKEKGVDPRVVFSQITGEHAEISDFVPDMALWRVSLVNYPKKQSHFCVPHTYCITYRSVCIGLASWLGNILALQLKKSNYNTPTLDSAAFISLST